ncbi:GDP-mannose 4,6-dehydratase [Mesorhizobium sp. M0674]|uniref:GDP-mannose 4,6-dehydratase n=1 Tax=unclassified Mesorhizobium TaxID=325217 RepID=UPI00333D7F47
MARLYDSRRRILVTGGAGFIGSHLIDRLLERGDEILCVDNLFTGSKRNIDHLAKHPRFEFMRHDVTFPLFVEVDEIYNLACPASPVHYQYDPVQTIKTAVHGAINVLGLAKRLKCFGDGSQTRSFCYVDDLVSGMLRLMDTGPEVTGPVNIGNPREVTIRRLAELTTQMTGSGSDIIYRDLPQDDPRHRQPDITLAKRLVGWEPTVTLEAGLQQTIDYFKALLPKVSTNSP